MAYPNNEYNVNLQRKYMNKYFFDAIHHILKATGTDENNQVLTKLYVKDDLICATNGHVLSWTNLTEGARKLFRDTNKLSTSGAANNGLYTVMKRLTGSIELEQSCYTDIDYPDILSVIPDLSNYHTNRKPSLYICPWKQGHTWRNKIKNSLRSFRTEIHRFPSRGWDSGKKKYI